jgi:hypothetical protein
VYGAPNGGSGNNGSISRYDGSSGHPPWRPMTVAAAWSPDVRISGSVIAYHFTSLFSDVCHWLLYLVMFVTDSESGPFYVAIALIRCFESV